MNFENPLFFSAVLIGPIFLIAGIILHQFPPKTINYLYGYRTKNSMKNQKSWSFSQKYAARIMAISGLIYTLILLILSNFNIDVTQGLIISLGLMISMPAGIYFFTEKKIKQ